MRLVVLTNILTPYRVPLFEEMRKSIDDFTVLLMAAHEENRRWKLPEHQFKTVLLPGIHLKKPGEEASRHINYGVLRALRRLDPDLVLSGGFGPANFSAWIYCKLFGKKYVGWGELTSSDAAQDSIARKTLRRTLTRWSDGAIASSKEAREVFIGYGAQEDRVFTSSMSIDVAYFHERTNDFRKTVANALRRAEYSGPILISIGQLIRRKGCFEMLKIYERILEKRPDVSLLIAGDGPDRALLEKTVKEKGFDRVAFLGYLQMEAVPELFAIADLFIFHTLFDPFGAVLSEAMAAEVPVIASIHAAATREWIEEGVTGFRIDPMRTRASSEVILKALDLSTEERRALGWRGYERIKGCDPKHSAAGMVRFLKWLNDSGDPQDRLPRKFSGNGHTPLRAGTTWLKK